MGSFPEMAFLAAENVIMSRGLGGSPVGPHMILTTQ